jgi:hypothetical protein
VKALVEATASATARVPWFRPDRRLGPSQ